MADYSLNPSREYGVLDDAQVQHVVSHELRLEPEVVEAEVKPNLTFMQKIFLFFYPTKLPQRDFEKDLQTQIEAIRKLGASENSNALPSLLELSVGGEFPFCNQGSFQGYNKESEGYNQCGPQEEDEIWDGRNRGLIFKHNAAVPPLRGSYCYYIENECWSGGGYVSLLDDFHRSFFEWDVSGKEMHDKIHAIVTKAIETLEETT